MQSISILWPARGAHAAAHTAIRIGAIAAANGACSVFALALAETRRSGLILSAAVLPLIGALIAMAAAAGISRRSRGAVYRAIVVWVTLGVLPSGVPLWLGLLVLACLTVAARGAYAASAQTGAT